MVKFKLYKNYFGNISFIVIDNIICTLNEMAQLLDIFKLQHLVVSITALWQDSAFFKFISKEKKQFKTFLPTKSTITSETIITANINDFFPFFDLLFASINFS